MSYVLLIMVVIFTSLQNVFVKQFEKKCNGGEWLFSATTVFFAEILFVISFLITNKNGFDISKETLIFSVLFSLFYSVGMIGQVFAIKNGSMALTSLMISFSLLIPTFFGIIVLNEEAGVLSYTGLVFLLISLYLVNYAKEKDASNQKITFKWIIFVLLASIGNGGCAVVQRTQQIYQNGHFKDEFMIIALSVVLIELLTISLIKEKNHIKTLKIALLPAFSRGVSNGLVNSLCLTLSLMMPASVMYPVSSGGGIALTAFIAVAFYREKLSSKQLIGLVFGIVSVVLLSII
ncbi:MAG: EamA family transporter [Clostridia bacterium]|nr:EamA family transporter [Clostridia bacterium]